MIPNYLQDYINLKAFCAKTLEQSDKREDVIKYMIELYGTNINSRRTVETITTPAKLIKILEKRDCLSHKNVKPFKEIGKELTEERIIEQTLEFERKINNIIFEDQNYYVNEEINEPETYYDNQGLSPRKEELIVKTIGEEIGNYWRNLARYLDLKEGAIDKIDRICLDDTNCIALKIITDIKDLYPREWSRKLCKALQKSRRQDLSHRIEKILVMSI